MTRQPKNGKPVPPELSTAGLSPEQATRKAVAAVYGGLGEIVTALLDKAREGSHLHAKLLFELAGISAASLPLEEGSDEPSLAQMLLRKLDQMSQESEAEDEERPVE